MNINQLKNTLGKQIVVYNVALFFLVVIIFILKGFDTDEFSTLLSALGPTTAIYTGTLFKFIGKQISHNAETVVASSEPMNSYIHKVIPFHFILIALLICARGVFNFITFQQMLLIFTFVEMCFGGYIGYIISALLGGD